MPKREFVEFQDATGLDLSGNKVSRAPELNLTSAIDYSIDLQGVSFSGSN